MTTEINTAGVPDEGWIQIANGHIFHPMDPRPEEVFIEDIAQSLSRSIRYNGHSDEIINVAHHSCNCAWLADTMGYNARVQLAMLMHEGGEYIVGDMIRPLKVKFPDFILIEDDIMAAINTRFNLPIIDHKLLKFFDNLALAWEKRDLYKSSREWPHMLAVPDWCPTINPWTHSYAEERFLSLFAWLQLEINTPEIKGRAFKYTLRKVEEED
jgi:hypothetical protein